MTVMLSAASCVDWAARMTGTHDAGEIIAKAAAKDRLDGPEIFLPYLSGERTPHNDPYARGVLFGLNHDTDPATVGQAVMEGVAFAFRDGLDALVEGGGTLNEVTVIGGGSRSAYWGRILSAALETPLVYRRDAEVGPAYGAAKLAQLSISDADPASVCAPPPVRETIEPKQADIDALAAKRERFGTLYKNLKSVFPQGDQ